MFMYYEMNKPLCFCTIETSTKIYNLLIFIAKESFGLKSLILFVDKNSISSIK